MAYQTLVIDAAPPFVATVALSRPQAANALNTQMALELKDFFSGPPASCRAIILTGAGRHFCAGADLKERNGMSDGAWKKQHRALREARDTVLACPLPVLAAVGGAAFGGGLELALSCDFIYAAREAVFALSETRLGIMPGMGGTQTLPRAVGERRAKELVFSGRTFSAQEAHEWGLVNKLCDAEKLLPQALAAANAIAEGAPLAVRAAKRAMIQSLEGGFAAELAHYNTLLATRDRREGIAAFNEKRTPDFTGE